MKFVATEQNVNAVKEVATEIDEHCHDMETKLSSIDASLVEIDGELEDLSSDIKGVKSDVAGVKSDVADVKTDVADVKTDVYSLKNDVSSVKQDVARVKDDCESIADTVDDIQNTVANTQTTVNSIASGMSSSEQIVTLSSTMAENQTETVGKLDSVAGDIAEMMAMFPIGIVKSVQRGSQTITASGAGPTAIRFAREVNPEKTLIITQGETGYSGGYTYMSKPTGVTAGGFNIYGGFNTPNTVVSWQAIEFY